MQRYASAKDLIDRFDAQELAQLAVPKEHVSIDAGLLQKTVAGGNRAAFKAAEIKAADAALVKINRALADATSEINAHLLGRYQLPLEQTPEVIKLKCADIARYLLHDDHPTDQVKQRYEDAMRYLQKVASGQISLGISQDNTAPKTARTVQFVPGPRVFSRKNAQDFI